MVLHCKCGETYQAEERHIGRKIQCRKCDRTILIEKDRPPSLTSTAATSSLHAPYAPKQFASSLLRNRRVLILVVIVIGLGAAGILRSLQSPKRESKQLNPTAQSSPAMSSASSLALSVDSNESSKPMLEPNRPPVALTNGADITPPQGSRGRGTLRVTNGTDYDAVVKLVDSISKKTRRFVYVRANSEVVVKSIGTCPCILKFNSGIDWDQSKRKFLRSQSFSQFDDVLSFRETRTNTGVEWAEFEVTLHPVLYGTARTTSINESDFEDQ